MTKRLNINIENYEAFLIDYFDGTLNDELTAELFTFLDSNPELKAEVMDLDSYALDSTMTKFDGSFLKKPENLIPDNFINDQNIDDYLIRALEKDLNDEEKESLRTFIAHHPQYQKNRKLVELLRLQPDFSICYPEMELLYKLSIDTHETVDQSNIEEFLIGELEGELNLQQKKDLEAFLLLHPEHQTSRNLISNLRLKPDLKIVFSDKSSLKYTAKVLWFNTTTYRFITSIAAVILIFLLFPHLLNDQSMNTMMVEKQGVHQSEKPGLQVETPKNNDAGVAVIVRDESKSQSIRSKNQKTIQNQPTISHKRQNISLQKVNLRQAELKMDDPEIKLNTVKPTLCFASDNLTRGYYQVIAQNDNFLNANPTLKRRLVKGIRNALNINQEEINAPDDKLTFWDVADVGIKTIGAMTENEVSLSRR